MNVPHFGLSTSISSDATDDVQPVLPLEYSMERDIVTPLRIRLEIVVIAPRPIAQKDIDEAI